MRLQDMFNLVFTSFFFFYFFVSGVDLGDST